MAIRSPLYQTCPGLRMLSTSIVSIQPFTALPDAHRSLFKTALDDSNVLETAETIFYAQGGGQPSDTGIIRSSSDSGPEFAVEAVRHAHEGQILHLGRFVPHDNIPFTPGDTVIQAIDAPKRHLHSQIHTAGHILGLAVRSLAPIIGSVRDGKASHFPGAASVEFYGLIDGKHKDVIQSKCDEMVRLSLPVKLLYCSKEDARAKCAMMPDDFEVPDGQSVRVIEIEGAGADPCGGTHVENTNLVGKVVVKKISRQKGVSKISYTI